MRCPWDQLAPAPLHLCEAPRCAWITEPANTWTNVGFLIVGVYILVHATRAGTPRARWLGAIAIATGLASAAFHATSTKLGMFLDFGAMQLQGAYLVTMNASRLLGWRGRPLAGLFAAVTAIGWAAIVLSGSGESPVFIVTVAVFWLSELRLAVRDRGTRYRPLAMVVVLFAISYGIWWLDRLGTICDPNNHVLGGHGAWHLLGAASFVYWYRFFAQFETRARRHSAGTAKT